MRCSIAFIKNKTTGWDKPKFHYADFATFTETSPRRKSQTQIIKVRDTNHVADFHDLCLSWTLSQTSRHVEMVCVRDFPRGQVSVKIGVMEFGLYTLISGV